MIPARYAASRFPGKLMQDLGGKTVIQRTYEATLSTALFDEVFVVTDSAIIYKEITSNGGHAIMSINEHDCGSDRIAEAVEHMDVDIVVNVQGDEPFTERESLKKVLEVFYHDDADRIDLASLMTPMDDIQDINNPNSVKVIIDKDNYALYFSRSPMPYPRDTTADHVYYKHKGVYAFRKQALLDFYKLPMRSLEASEKIECIRYLEYGKHIKMIETQHQGIEIDTPEDLERARILIKSESVIQETGLKDASDNKTDYRNFPMVPRVIFGAGSFDQLGTILKEKRQRNSPFIFFIGIIGLGGGSIMDLAKAVAIMLTNPGNASDYQGWDLVNKKAIYHVGIPTISGTGAEVSRTTVLTGPERKLGINSDYTPFDQVILDPDLIAGVPKNQWFYTGMDCYIHCIESLDGTYLNAFSQSYGEKALDLCKEVFLGENIPKKEANAKLMMASWHGGMSIAYSQVGIAHAMSYGLSYVLGTKHGVGNCIVFDKLEEYYPRGVAMFKKMKALHGVTLPKGVCSELTEAQFDTMISVALSLVPLWENALGIDWRSKIDSDKLRAIYKQL